PPHLPSFPTRRSSDLERAGDPPRPRRGPVLGRAGLSVLRRGGPGGGPRHALRRLPRQRRRGAGPGRCRRQPHRRRRGPLRPLEGEHLMSTGTTPSIAWIGLGAIGAPMARTAAEAGFPVTAFDLAPAARDALADVAAPAASAREAADGADVVVVMVATPAQLEAVLWGEDGIAEVLRPST